MRAGHHNLFHKIFLAGGKSRYALAAAALRTVGAAGQALYISEMSHGYHHVLFLNQGFQINFVAQSGYLCAAFISVFFHNGGGLVLYNAQHL